MISSRLKIEKLVLFIYSCFNTVILVTTFSKYVGP